MTEVPAELELRNRAYAFGPHQKRMAWVVFWLLGVLVGVAAVLAARLLADPAVAEAARQLVDQRAAHSWQALGFGVVILLAALQFGYLWLASRGERLILDESGIRFQSPFPRALQFLYPGWSVKWDEVRRARLERIAWAPGPASAVLVLTTYAGERRIRPYVWVDAKLAVHETPMQALRRLQALGEAELVRTVTESPLIQYVKARRPRLDLGEAGLSFRHAFALERNRRALIAVVAFFVLVTYTVADSLLNQEAYAAAPPFAIFVAGGCLATVIAFPWLRRSAVPMAESLVVALLLGVAGGAALYPGLLRINQLTDTGGLQTVRYVLQRDFSLAPEIDGPPVLAFPAFPEYWLQFPPGSTHEFPMRRGGLEFYQIDMAPVYAKTREFYRSRP